MVYYIYMLHGGDWMQFPGLLILAGGQSSRMSRDKTALPWHDTDLLTDLLLRSKAFPFPERLLSINRSYEPSRLPVETARTLRTIADAHPGCGPLSGLEAAFAQGTCDAYLVLSADLPFYDFSPLAALMHCLQDQPELQAVIARTKDGRDQPLAALYRRSLLPDIRRRLQDGDYRLRRLYASARTAYVDESARSALYFNVNTPQDYETAKGRDLNSRRKVPVVTLTAPHSGSGKTTAAVTAITKLTALGYRVAYIKSTHHTVLREKSGSDTDRARSACAVSVCLCGPYDCPPGTSKEDGLLALSQEQPADLVLIESRSHGPLPRIDVTRTAPEKVTDTILFLTGCRSSAI